MQQLAHDRSIEFSGRGVINLRHTILRGSSLHEVAPAGCAESRGNHYAAHFGMFHTWWRYVGH